MIIKYKSCIFNIYISFDKEYWKIDIGLWKINSNLKIQNHIFFIYYILYYYILYIIITIYKSLFFTIKYSKIQKVIYL